MNNCTVPSLAAFLSTKVRSNSNSYLTQFKPRRKWTKFMWFICKLMASLGFGSSPVCEMILQLVSITRKESWLFTVDIVLHKCVRVPSYVNGILVGTSWLQTRVSISQVSYLSFLSSSSFPLFLSFFPLSLINYANGKLQNGRIWGKNIERPPSLPFQRN